MKKRARRAGDTSAAIDFGIEALARAGDRIGIDVGGEDLKLDVARCRRDLLAKEHGKGIGFLARAASRDPDAQRLIGRVVADKAGHDLLRQEIEHIRIAEEAGDVDEQILGEKIEFVLRRCAEA